MKPLLLSTFVFCIFLFSSVAGWTQPQSTAQGMMLFDGNDSLTPYCIIYRDTVSNPNCIWQIGNPQKPVFNLPVTSPNVIVTDTLGAYPPNDTSSFIIAQKPNSGWWIFNPYTPFMIGYYRVDADTLTDFGQIEVRLNGLTGWINILEDTLYNFFPSLGDKPILTGNSGEWKSFMINFSSLCDSLNLPWNWNDTIFMRFSFLSDNIQTNRDGLMFDDFLFWDAEDNVRPIDRKSQVSVAYPNPAKERLVIFPSQRYNRREVQLIVTDGLGQNVYARRIAAGEQLIIDTGFLPAGIYYLTIKGEEGNEVLKFLKM